MDELDNLKQIYDCVFLKKLFNGNQNVNISSLMVKYYEQHKEDLKFLKELLVGFLFFQQSQRNLAVFLHCA